MQDFYDPSGLASVSKESGKPILFFRWKREAGYCSGCGLYDRPNYSNDLCRTCYANWMRQNRKWKGRAEFPVPARASDYRETARKMYGRNPHCTECGVRSFIPDKPCRLAAPTPRTDHTLMIHHIDGNRKNNAPSNLMPLCGICHKAKHKT